MNVLIIDDNQMNLDLFCHMLSMIDTVAPLPMSDPAAALARCATMTPDLVLVDYMMPEIDGLEFLRRFRQLPGMTGGPVIMVTADTELTVRHEALRLSANDFLTKPVNYTELNVRVGNLLALRRAQLQLAERADWLAQAVHNATTDLVASEREVVHRLSRAAEFRDPETGSHLLRMSAYARLVAVNLGLPLAECELICEAAPMHDIGKVGIPDSVLLKPGPLDPDEIAIMRAHPQIGADILSGSESALLQAGAVIAISHHVRYDGRGYPHGLAGEAIPLYGRIVAVADVFDALTTSRPYKAGWELERAVAHLREGSGTQFDPRCVAALLQDMEAMLEIQRRCQDYDTERRAA
ncbi:response regulator RpfG [Janthinobacterium sp. HH01]|uniref:HD domain-containing phosphohydrolase n=1 Tax=Janthinobacterium sp. HH01 TaxID=1198452 RepID=UPI0002AE8CB3|nr:HD domain-containing phosphohydrolase [Janthinobacterium sp. HH01]ELX08816.1 response regulator RpfG [Janthinobacterium sp. HH01]